MKQITLADLQELGKFLVKCRPMTEEEIENFRVIPRGATKYKSFKSYVAACQKLDGENATYEAGSNPDEGLFWIERR